MQFLLIHHTQFYQTVWNKYYINVFKYTFRVYAAYFLILNKAEFYITSVENSFIDRFIYFLGKTNFNLKFSKINNQQCICPVSQQALESDTKSW